MRDEPPATQRFVLEVQPASLLRPWHAWLHDERGHTAEFDSPLELLRHLLSLNETAPPAGGLR